MWKETLLIISSSCWNLHEFILSGHPLQQQFSYNSYQLKTAQQNIMCATQKGYSSVDIVDEDRDFCNAHLHQHPRVQLFETSFMNLLFTRQEAAINSAFFPLLSWKGPLWRLINISLLMSPSVCPSKWVHTTNPPKDDQPQLPQPSIQSAAWSSQILKYTLVYLRNEKDLLDL